jgi:hypothetical protein
VKRFTEFRSAKVVERTGEVRKKEAGYVTKYKSGSQRNRKQFVGEQKEKRIRDKVSSVEKYDWIRAVPEKNKDQDADRSHQLFWRYLDEFGGICMIQREVQRKLFFYVWLPKKQRGC